MLLPDERNLIERARQGDKGAFAEIFERYHQPVYTYVYYRVGHTRLAEDLTGEVFVRLVKHIGNYHDQGRPLLAWLHTLAANLVIDHYRHDGHEAMLPVSELVVDGAAGPGQLAEKQLLQSDLIAALNRLTEEQRQVVLLKFVEDRSNSEVAAVLGKNEGSVKSLQHRALAALRRILSQEYGYETA